MAGGGSYFELGGNIFRHTFATHLLNWGMRPEHVMVLMGHEQMKTVMRYAKVDEEKAFEPMKRYFVGYSNEITLITFGGPSEKAESLQH